MYCTCSHREGYYCCCQTLHARQLGYTLRHEYVSGRAGGEEGQEKEPLFEQAAFLSLSNRTKQQSIETTIQTHQSIHALFPSPEILSPLTIVHTETGYLLKRDPQRGGGGYGIHRELRCTPCVYMHPDPHLRPCTTVLLLCLYLSFRFRVQSRLLHCPTSVNALTPVVYHSLTTPNTALLSDVFVFLVCTPPV